MVVPVEVGVGVVPPEPPPSAAVVTLRGLVVADGSPVPVTCKVKSVPASSRLRPWKLATPPLTTAVSVPPRLPSTAMFVGETARLPPKEVTGLPYWSATATVSPNAAPAWTVAGGWDVTTSCAAVPAVTLKASEFNSGGVRLLDPLAVALSV